MGNDHVRFLGGAVMPPPYPTESILAPMWSMKRSIRALSASSGGMLVPKCCSVAATFSTSLL